ncbi:MAG TPA: glutathione S-transferase family protein [Caulobacteraceae bacterium]|jgi:glutathione S-transferase|nr:glutathione S-transferase family protein [Caulobacteraceae bacterium]
MSTAADGIILHHYDASPFSEKVRLMLGLKGLAWRSVQTPNMLPKPDLAPLTGGYRRAPVMQIGADVFCDSQVILAELERLRPEPAAVTGPAFAVNLWADRLFFMPSVAVIFGEIGHTVPQAFIDDREKMSGNVFNTAAMKAAAIPMRGQWRAHAAWIEQALVSQGGPFLAGERPGLADISAYMNVWFLRGALPDLADTLLQGLDNVRAWRLRVAAIGHGQRTEITGSDALEAARTSEPGAAPAHDSADPLGLAPGADVVVMADDYGRDPIAGKLVAANRDRVTIARQEPALGRLQLHFPRAGFVVSPAPSPAE